MSSSTMPSVPTPAAARYSQHRRAEPAGADHQHARALQPLLAGAADLRQHDVARIAFELFGRERRRLVSGHRAKHSAARPPLSAPAVGDARHASTVRNCARPVQAGKQRRLGAGHEGLAVEVVEDREQRRAAAGIEMRGDLVEQQDRRRCRTSRAVSRACESTMPTSSAFCSPVEQSSAGMAFGRVADQKVGAMRAVERAPGGAVALAAGGQRLRGSSPRPRPPARSPTCALERRRRARVGLRERAVVRQLVDHRRRAAAPVSARAAAIATPVSAICASIASNQAAVARILGEQAVAAAHRLFVVERALAVAGIDRQHQPVEEAAAVAGRPGEQRIHRRRHPDARAAIRACPRPSVRWRR